ncbi:hypothetical protein ABB26_00655 [Stenotrophomonas humi]|uniref:Outer membrane protein beta-barrel domain-containing protein n=1 Tax=Stenotrophomonas humi TaxID=405444 RepID=A0A0R0CMW3_9GAMM|nr:hypothetical protein [Stenotrophomonas humi]KRG66403.1 hypothetical protein ABB26_00655 [Stenotrophomonas humi]
MNIRFKPGRQRLSLLALLAMGGIPLAQAQSAEAGDVAADAWRFQATPYVWMSGMEGQVRPFRSAPMADVHKSFSELMDSLDAAAFITGTARRGNFVLQADVTHASTSDAAPLPIGVVAKVKVRQSSATVTAGYAWMATERTGIDLMGGLRYWDISAAVNVPGLVSARSDASFVDPIAALRWRQALAPRWSSVAYVDVGGFGVGSDATWQVVALANYQANDNLFLSMGYRHLSVDYRDSGKRLDVSLSGPMLGLTYRFGPGRSTGPL